jgi:hypothetical protein
LVLLGVGPTSPTGFGATWALAWAAVNLGLLVWLLLQSLRTLEADVLQRRRLQRARDGVVRQVASVISRRISSALLNAVCVDAKIDYRPFRASDEVDRGLIAARSTGRVKDVRLRVLRKVGFESETRLLPRPELYVRLGQRIGTAHLIAWMHPSLWSVVPRASRIVRVAPAKADVFLVLLNDLHEEALAAIRDERPRTYESIVEVYEEILTALPEAWARYGQSLQDDLGVSADPFELSFLDHLRRQLHEQAAASLTR